MEKKKSQRKKPSTEKHNKTNLSQNKEKRDFLELNFRLVFLFLMSSCICKFKCVFEGGSCLDWPPAAETSGCGEVTGVGSPTEDVFLRGIDMHEAELSPDQSERRWRGASFAETEEQSKGALR